MLYNMYTSFAVVVKILTLYVSLSGSRHGTFISMTQSVSFVTINFKYSTTDKLVMTLIIAKNHIKS